MQASRLHELCIQQIISVGKASLHSEIHDYHIINLTFSGIHLSYKPHPLMGFADMCRVREKFHLIYPALQMYGFGLN